MFQSIFYTVFQWARILSSIIFALAMKSPLAQFIFFVFIAVISLSASFSYRRNTYIKAVSYLGATEKYSSKYIT